MKKLWNFITSHYLCVYTGIAFIAAGLLLSLRLNGDGGYYSKIDSGILLDWVVSKLHEPFTISSFAFFFMIVITALLFQNALLCTGRRLYHLIKGGVRWRKYLPHLMHIGFLVVVIGHLVSSISGEKIRSILVFEGSFSRIRGTPYYVKLNGMDLKLSEEGYPVEFSADITLFEGTKELAGGNVKVNHPLIYDDYGIYIKNAGRDRIGRRYVLFDANRDDGAGIVLAGGILFTLVNFLYLFPYKTNEVSYEGETPG